MSEQQGPKSSALVPVRLKPALLVRLDDWITKRDHKPSRPEAIRELLEQVLGTEEAIVGLQSKELMQESNTLKRKPPI